MRQMPDKELRNVTLILLGLSLGSWIIIGLLCLVLFK